MKLYWVKTHWLIKRILSGLIWDLPNKKKVVYLTFDDGPTPEVTNWTLEQLKLYNAKATFFCIGENAVKHAELFKNIQKEGHTIGNHTYNHLNGWKTDTTEYLLNIQKCQNVLHDLSENKTQITTLFRPPYGKMKYKQYRFLKKNGYKIVMWDILSADFDTTISAEECKKNVLNNIKSGSIVIFHDSKKAEPHLIHTLPKTLKYLRENGFEMKSIKFAPVPN